ncbi:uncharacterized protein LOC143234880 [Tachypleus tridentatus]|uniref:uncharacterized protein LOC143234880 n=1 Tax=Tachypleus tridentatus TaxID=6853 RepID=UPI003FD310B4
MPHYRNRPLQVHRHSSSYRQDRYDLRKKVLIKNLMRNQHRVQYNLDIQNVEEKQEGKLSNESALGTSQSLYKFGNITLDLRYVSIHRGDYPFNELETFKEDWLIGESTDEQNNFMNNETTLNMSKEESKDWTNGKETTNHVFKRKLRSSEDNKLRVPMVSKDQSEFKRKRRGGRSTLQVRALSNSNDSSKSTGSPQTTVEIWNSDELSDYQEMIAYESNDARNDISLPLKPVENISVSKHFNRFRKTRKCGTPIKKDKKRCNVKQRSSFRKGLKRLLFSKCSPKENSCLGENSDKKTSVTRWVRGFKRFHSKTNKGTACKCNPTETESGEGRENTDTNRLAKVTRSVSVYEPSQQKHLRKLRRNAFSLRLKLKDSWESMEKWIVCASNERLNGKWLVITTHCQLLKEKACLV